MYKRLWLVFLMLATISGTASKDWAQQPAAKHHNPPRFLQQILERSHKQFAGKASRKRSQSRPQGLAALVTPAPFLAATTVDAGGATSYQLAQGDVNGDKRSDAIVVVQNSASSTGNYLQVLLNQASGIFAAPISTPVSFGQNHFLLVADLNKDGKDDVVLVHPGSIDVLLSNGDGTFATPQSQSTGIDWPVAASTWDVNHDKLIDIALVDGISNQSAFLAGNGKGGFQAPQSATFPVQASTGVLADVDLDGNLDFVTNTAIYPGDGNGGFLSAVTLVSNDGENAGATSASSVAVGDVNGDGLPDLVTANGFWNTVTVFLNQRNRSFMQDGVSYWVGNVPVAVTIGDVNWDNTLDLVVSNEAQSDLAVLIGKGDGEFLPVSGTYAVGGSPATAAVLADFDGDGNLDALIADNRSSLVLALGSGDGTFHAANDFAAVVAPGSNTVGGAFSIASGDFNGDGLPDLVVGQSSISTGMGVAVFLTQSNGSLGAATVYAQEDALSFVAVGDINHDGKADIVASNWTSGGVTVLLGKGDGTFQSPADVAIPAYMNGIVVADFNGDGWPDVAVAGIDPQAYILLNDGTGQLLPSGTYPLPGMANQLVAADLNNDGKLDLCLAVTGSSTVSLLMGRGDGTFSAAASFDTTQSEPYGIAVGDLNADGKPDLVVTSLGDGSLAVILGNGNGSFKPPVIYSATSNTSQISPFPADVRLADVNGDGSLDVVYANSGLSSLGVLLGNGDGTFSGPLEYPAGGDSFGLIALDLNQDGWADVVTADANFTGVSVFRNISAPQATPDFSISATPSSLEIAAGANGAVTVSMTSINGFNESVQLSCQNLPAALTCSFSPALLHMSKGATVTSKLSITAVRGAAAASYIASGFMASALMPLLGVMFFSRERKPSRRKTMLGLLILSVALFSGCGSLGSGSPKKPQTYTISVVAVSGKGTTHSVPLQVTVQP